MKNPNKYSGLIQLTHWISAPLVIGLFILGVWMVELSYYNEWYQKAPNIHKSLGIILFFIMLIRTFAKLFQSSPSALPHNKGWQNTLASLTHGFMYVAIFSIIISGYLISTASDSGISVFGWFTVPAIISYGDTQADTAGLIHQYAAYVLIAVVVLHIAAFFQHQFLYKDQIINRITPFK